MYNSSFVAGVLPASQKHAIIKPGLKKPTLDPDDLISYRPISNLSLISKTIERVVAVRFNEHCDVHKLLPVCQPAYSACHSTETAVTIVHNNIVQIMEQNDRVSVPVFLDLSVAFDTVDHALLLVAPEKRFGIHGMSLTWYRTYMTEHTQTFQVGRDRSTTFVVRCNVPQGSVLSPLKFLLYREDLPAVIEKRSIDPYQYADDVQLNVHLQINDVNAALQNMETCVGDVQNWCTSKRLQLNSSKTEVIFWFGTNNSLKKLSGTDLCHRIETDAIYQLNLFVALVLFSITN